MNPPTLFDTLPPRRAATLESWLRDRDRDGGIERNAVSSRLRELDRWFGFAVKVATRQAPTGKPEKAYAPTADGAAWVQMRRAVQS